MLFILGSKLNIFTHIFKRKKVNNCVGKLEDLKNLIFEIFSDITNYNRIHGDSEGVYDALVNLIKSNKMQ